MAWGYWSATSVLPDRRSPRRGTTVAHQLPAAAPAPVPAVHTGQTAPAPGQPCSSSSSSSADGPLAAGPGQQVAGAQGQGVAPAGSCAEPIRAQRRPSLDLYAGQLDEPPDGLGYRDVGGRMTLDRHGMPLCSSAPHAHQMQPPAPQYRAVPWAASTNAVHLDDPHDELVINHSYCPRLDHRHPGHGHGHSHLHGLLAGPGGPGPGGPGPGGHHHHHHPMGPVPAAPGPGPGPNQYRAQVQYHRADMEPSDDEEEPGYASGEHDPVTPGPDPPLGWLSPPPLPAPPRTTPPHPTHRPPQGLQPAARRFGPSPPSHSTWAPPRPAPPPHGARLMSYRAEMAKVHRSSQNPNQARTPDPSGRADRRNAILRLRSKVVGGRWGRRRTLRRHFKDNYSGPENLESRGNEPFVGRGALLIHNAEDHSGEVNSKEHGSNSGNKSQSKEKSKNYSSKCDKCNLNFSSTQSFAKNIT
ncbi:hypothetical protein KUF71_024359 [Frankliniella fusca]|uniref:Uncharacterized protein n=1 Tax=Frankliniella fusca TaxID=407009 RepID=A0AAE1LEE6_9NEOP|nr:hypothetical protein KUF71_024359 [Frankliniella fusca]